MANIIYQNLSPTITVLGTSESQVSTVDYVLCEAFKLLTYSFFYSSSQQTYIESTIHVVGWQWRQKNFIRD